CRGRGCGASTRLALPYGGDHAVTRARDRHAAWHSGADACSKVDGETTWRFGNARAPSNRRCRQNQHPTEQSHGCLLALWVGVRRTECVAMAIADMPVLRQKSETSG